jgi:hypothetical protein
MKKLILAILLLLPVVAFAGPGGLQTDRWGNKIPLFAPYSTVAKVFTGGTLSAERTSITITLTEVILGVQFSCTKACVVRFNDQTSMSSYPIRATTDYTIIRNSSASKLVFTQASSSANICTFLIH